MVQRWHADLVKYENLSKLSHGNTESYVMTVVEAAMFTEIMLWSSLLPFSRKLCFACGGKCLITLVTL